MNNYGFKIDFWMFWGLIAQSFFFLRLIIQWIASERAKTTIVPKSFWWLGNIGAIMLGVYAIARLDLVFIITSVLQLFIYTRNLVIAYQADNKGKVDEKE